MIFEAAWTWILSALFTNTSHASPPANLGPVLQSLVQREDTATLFNRPHVLNALFVDDHAGQRAKLKATSRMDYLQAWARARQIDFLKVSVLVRSGPPHWISPHLVKIYGVVSARYQYRHRLGNTTPAWFGLGVYHWYTLYWKNNQWKIAGDVFIDPLNQETRLIGPAIPVPVRVPEFSRHHQLSPGAALALQYARTYCGAAPGCANQNRYNPRYHDYNWDGGDCTNFISQVLHAGGLSQTPAWSWDMKHDEGTSAWVNATTLAGYLVYSERAHLYAHGTFTQLTQSASKPIQNLQRGDLIGYYENHRTVHLAIVAGFDPDGYPLVISHSADRFEEPWDLGWDRTTRYYFYRIHYPLIRHSGSPVG